MGPQLALQWAGLSLTSGYGVTFAVAVEASFGLLPYLRSTFNSLRS